MKILKIDCIAPAMRKVPHKYDWEYSEPWECVLHTDEGVITLNVDSSYRTDLASVPQALKGLMDNGSADYGVLIACQIHDFGYATQYLSKELSDELFYLALRYYGISWVKAQLYYNAVRLFGDDAYYLGNDEIEHDRILCRIFWGSN